jgi:competence protein ComGC
LEGFTKYAVEIGSGAMILIPSFIKRQSKVNGRGKNSQSHSIKIVETYFHFFRIRKVG